MLFKSSKNFMVIYRQRWTEREKGSQCDCYSEGDDKCRLPTRRCTIFSLIFMAQSARHIYLCCPEKYCPGSGVRSILAGVAFFRRKINSSFLIAYCMIQVTLKESVCSQLLFSCQNAVVQENCDEIVFSERMALLRIIKENTVGTTVDVLFCTSSLFAYGILAAFFHFIELLPFH